MKSTKGNINTKKNVSEKGITLLALVECVRKRNNIIGTSNHNYHTFNISGNINNNVSRKRRITK